MYPSRFRYEAPRSLDEAIATLRDGGDYAKVLAGGQSLVPMMKLRFASPELLVDINNVPGLDYHRTDPDGTLRIGALCRHADLERSALLKSSQPTMAAAAPLIADPIVRTRGTLVGSVCHADPQGDWASVVLALGGSVVAQGPRGRRTIRVADFVTGPFENVLEPDEIAVEALIPPATGARAGAPQARAPGGRLRHGRGGGGPGNVRSHRDQSRDLADRGGARPSGHRGRRCAGGPALTAQTIEMAAGWPGTYARPRTDHRGSADYKRHMVRTFVTRLLNRAGGREEDSAGAGSSGERAA
jgi:carbon-monoxide dehydrogenase medium subunit